MDFILAFTVLLTYDHVLCSRTSQSSKEESEEFNFSEEDWNQLNKIIGYKEGDDEQLAVNSKADVIHTFLEVHMNHNASKLIGETKESVAELSCEDLSCSIILYPETKVFDIKLGSYKLSSPKGLLAEVGLLIIDVNFLHFDFYACIILFVIS